MVNLQKKWSNKFIIEECERSIISNDGKLLFKIRYNELNYNLKIVKIENAQKKKIISGNENNKNKA